MPTAAELEAHFPRLFDRAGRGAAPPIAEVLRTRTVAPGERLLDPAVPNHSLYLVWSGRLEVEVKANGRSKVLGDVGPGNWVGDVTFIEEGRPSAAVTAREPCTVLALDAEAFGTLERNEPAAARAILHGVCDDLSARLRSSSDVLWMMTTGESPTPEAEPAEKGWLRRAWHRIHGGGMS